MRTFVWTFALAALALGAAPIQQKPRIDPDTPAAIRIEHGDRLSFRITGAQTFSGVVALSKDTPPSWWGRLEGVPGTFTVFDYRRQRYALVHLADRTYLLEMLPARSGRDLTLLTIDHATLPRRCGVGLRPTQPVPMAPGAGGECDEAEHLPPVVENTCAEQATPTSVEMIDLAIGYTPAAEESVGHEAITIATIASVAEANFALLVSGGQAQFRIAERGLCFRHTKCIERIEYDESTKTMRQIQDDLVRGTEEGPRSLQKLRNRCNADAATLLVSSTPDGTFGHSCVMKTPTPAFEAYAFTVVNARSSFARSTFLHEIGHMMGAGHEGEEEQEGQEGANLTRPCEGPPTGMCDDSKALLLDEEVTLMHSQLVHFSRAHFFSNLNGPDPLTGKSMGTPCANNARTLNITAKTVAAFR